MLCGKGQSIFVGGLDWAVAPLKGGISSQLVGFI
jgi:hypothetical protein